MVNHVTVLVLIVNVNKGEEGFVNVNIRPTRVQTSKHSSDLQLLLNLIKHQM